MQEAGVKKQDSGNQYKEDLSMKRLVCVLLAVLLLSVPVLAAEYDLGGRTIKIAGHSAEGMRQYFTDGEGRGRLELVEEAFNCKIEFVQIDWDGAENRILASIVAGDPVGDLIYISNRWLPLLAGNGALLPLDDILTEEYYASLPGSHQRMRELYSSYQGKAYGISVNGSYQRNMDIGSAQGWIYNRDMFVAAGLPTPNELQNEGKWNWETMKELAIALTQDIDGDGVVDIYGVGARLDPWPIEQEMAVYANGGGIMKFVDGKAVYAMNDPEAIEAIEMWKELDQVHGCVMVGDKFDIRGHVPSRPLCSAGPCQGSRLRLRLGLLPHGPQSHGLREPGLGYGYVCPARILPGA